MTRPRRVFTVPGVGQFELSDTQLQGLVTGKVEVDEADPEIKVLRKIAYEGPYHSSVTLLADLWDDLIWEAFLENILSELNSQGLIVYSLVRVADSRQSGGQVAFWHEIPANIRVTKRGGDLVGLNQPSIVFGDIPSYHRRGFIPPPKGHWVDFTRFWHHDYHAVGGAITRESILEHMVSFPNHVHDLGGVLMTIQSIQEAPNARLMELARRIQNDLGVTSGTAMRMAREKMLETEPPAPAGFSLKDNILEAMRRINSLPGSGTDHIHNRLKAMGVKTNVAEITGLLWDLQKQQFVNFKEIHNSTGSELRNVRLTALGKKRAADRAGVPIIKPPNPNPKGNKRPEKPVIVHAAERREPEVIPSQTLPPTPAPAPIPARPMEQNRRTSASVIGEIEPGRVELSSVKWPLLSALMERARTVEEARTKASKLLEAASLVASVDQSAADSLMARAQEIEGVSKLTDEQKEMLRFVEEAIG